MKSRIFRILTIIAVTFTVVMFTAYKPPVNEDYLIISWNDLGMHCANKDFSKICVLPPYNNLKAQVILRGNATTLPQLITSDISVNYSIPGNTISTNKTLYRDWETDRKSTRLNSSHSAKSRMPSSA